MNDVIPLITKPLKTDGVRAKLPALIDETLDVVPLFCAPATESNAGVPEVSCQHCTVRVGTNVPVPVIVNVCAALTVGLIRNHTAMKLFPALPG